MFTAEGTLTWMAAEGCPKLLATPVAASLRRILSPRVAEMNPDLADTATFSASYDSRAAHSGNVVVAAGWREEVRDAAVVVLALDRAKSDGVVPRHHDVRKIGFAAMDDSIALTELEHGGITLFGLPDGWPVLVDSAVVRAHTVVVSSCVRTSQLLVHVDDLVSLLGVEVIPLAKAAPPS